MTISLTNPKVDFYFEKQQKWRDEINKLRLIALSCGLTEELKWGVPCYTFPSEKAGGKPSNVVIIHVFKEYCAFLFFKGALLQDPHAILIQQSENVQAARQARFTSISTINELADILKSYINEAIQAEKAGLKVPLKSVSEFAVSVAFQQRLDSIPSLKTAFEALSPGRQRAYLLYFSAPKQLKTQEARVEKCMPDILNGKGLND